MYVSPCLLLSEVCGVLADGGIVGSLESGSNFGTCQDVVLFGFIADTAANRMWLLFASSDKRYFREDTFSCFNVGALLSIAAPSNTNY